MVKYLNLSFSLRNQTRKAISATSFSVELEILTSVTNKQEKERIDLTFGNKEAELSEGSDDVAVSLTTSKGIPDY